MARARLYQRAKNVVHGIQLLVILIGVTLTIVILTKGPKDSRLTYYFVLCLLSFPFLIYQTIFPVVKLTRRLANAYVHLAFDLILVVLWLSGFVAEIVWIKDGSKAAEDWKKGDKVCEKFGWGPTSRCKLGQGTVIIGIVICILFAFTTFFSIYGISFYKRYGCLPGQDSSKQIEAGISAADRGDQEDVSSLTPRHTKTQGAEMSSVTRHNQSRPTFQHSSREQTNLPDRPQSWQLPVHTEYNSTLEENPDPSSHDSQEDRPYSPPHSNEIPNYSTYPLPTYNAEPSVFNPSNHHHHQQQEQRLKNIQSSSPPDPYYTRYTLSSTSPFPYSQQDLRTSSPLQSPERPVPRIRVDTAFANQINQIRPGGHGYARQSDQGARVEFPQGDYDR